MKSLLALAALAGLALQATSELAVANPATNPTTNTEAEAQDHAVVAALLRLPQGTLQKLPQQRPAVLRYLEGVAGTTEYIDVARRLQVFDQTDVLLETLANAESATIAAESAKILIHSGQTSALNVMLRDCEDAQAVRAATALGYVNQPQAYEALQLLLNASDRSPQVKAATAKALGRSGPGQQILLALAKSGEISPEIKFEMTNALLGSKNNKIRTQASRLLEPPATAGSETIPPLQELISKRGDAQAGKLVFNTVGTCNKCHQVGSEGKNVGPSLSEIGSKLSREDLYVAILDPSAAVSHNFETYNLLDADGKVTSGLLINQTDELVTIRNAEGVDTTVSTEDIEILKKLSVSLMPADLQRAMTLENLVDLVDYLVQLRKPGEAANRTRVEIDTSHDPQQAIAGFDIADGVDVQLFASEPMLLSPTSIDVDSLGRVWVCEAVNYRHFRNQNNEQRSEGDRILVLEDTDGDGQADKRTVFHQGTDIDSPHGVCVLGNEVIVSAGANVFVFTDSDGDLKADSRRTLFTGIDGVQHDHGIHAFGIGPDNKLYFNFGNAGKQLRHPDGSPVVDQAGNEVNDSRNPYQHGMVFRCNMDGSDLETLGWNFRNNWEVCVDSFGGLWQSDNDDDGNRGTRINFVMEFGNYGYRDELTGASWQTKRIGLENEIPLQHWHLNDPGVVPNVVQTGAGSPTGIFMYEGSLLPEQFQNQLLHTDPGPNVVRAYPVENKGAGYSGSIRNLVKGIRDPWFRPVDVCAAPDGSLFVADWYDPGVGGHRMGDSKHGRIFRIVPEGHEGYAMPELELGTPEAAVAALQSPNLATRHLAHTALASFGAGAVPSLEELADNSNNPRMQARALWQLAAVSGTPLKYIKQAIASDSNDLRMLAIRIARQHTTDPLPHVQQLARDPSPQVRRELAIAIRHNKSPLAVQLWTELAMQHDGQDRWYLEALGIAADQQWDRFFDAWLAKVGEDWNTPGGRDIVWRCRSPKACRYLAEIIRATKNKEEQFRYFRAFDFHEGTPKMEALGDLVTKR